jgi:hypothetical protein
VLLEAAAAAKAVNPVAPLLLLLLEDDILVLVCSVARPNLVKAVWEATKRNDNRGAKCAKSGVGHNVNFTSIAITRISLCKFH